MIDWSLTASIVSTILGILLGAFSTYMFIHAKIAQGKTDGALEGIKVQAELLSRITEKQLGKLIDQISTADPNLELVLGALTTLKAGGGNRSQNTISDDSIYASNPTLHACVLVMFFSIAYIRAVKTRDAPINERTMLFAEESYRLTKKYISENEEIQKFLKENHLAQEHKDFVEELDRLFVKP